MKNELFKDPFVVLMVVSREVRHPEELERLVTDIDYLRQERDRILSKGNPGGEIETFAETIMDAEWRKNNELSDNLSVSITKLAMLFLRDKTIRNFFNEEERNIMLEDMRNTVKRVNALSGVMA
ncbi:hypothetical protein E1L24_22530 [Salmonella enterica subsp. enterica serovar Braenderup]|nr:hypothetical protein [Salmonella enterica subsp. enterica serovar Braenderup]